MQKFSLQKIKNQKFKYSYLIYIYIEWTYILNPDLLPNLAVAADLNPMFISQLTC